MATIATEDGRDLLIQVDDLEPYRIHPLPGGAGHQITEAYLAVARGESDGEDIPEALSIALNGAEYDETADRWRLPKLLPISRRLEREVRLAEIESVAYCAFYWQTIVGIAGVNAFLEAGGGIAGQVKALWVMAARMGLSTSQTSPLSALESLTQMAGTPTTSSPASSSKPGKQPRDRRAKHAKR